uniref:Uncharacterized protein n=1 Tax=Eucampia antarctica TaxID=49252 RepID=A0A7S2WEM3_9STRA|mmetsp:Transcript_27787/g.26588  ORF Transcript_27787/g.26588 Transcript_27787/m.26588 type:complete len:292 (+) Transcript_27787:167-1042(+)|eukprot:CAMPEP_0197824220 /NCGR_PEP_ID=MMETSP1437-20131217/1505_1 /TAXON_ID=49252 ORGANISM="Eucampia antarctica, Strain CCMP1452" /NCGR_SAMPLE_ID=MMETSP1437 /ASSEMBLY_ACC=CAM_ASM_001096 /LENGTH=291 /DNA_ID=CAMNT_0043423763 /DNA_START=137 /DNA_END=1012 /DNA_ORIENTATION=-
MWGINALRIALIFSQSCGINGFITTSTKVVQGSLNEVIGRHGKFNSRVMMAFQKSDDDGFEIRSETSFKPETSFGADAVPEGQRPTNEYLDLISSPMFDWASQESGNKGLLIRLGIVYAVFYGISYPISLATFTQEGYLLNTVVSSNVAALGIVFLVLIRLYSGWGYIGSRLKDKVIEYEETGWYDGDVELKTEAEKARDLFLYRSDVKPVENRLKTFTLITGTLWLASCISLNLVMSANPLFNEYDADMLIQLPGNDKLANVAARQSNGQPTYCNSRYYRAIANGGQGCN